MLQSLSIKNVALIKEIEIDFGKGFNVLVGETGAGKSIIFDSLNFVLGSKADKTLIRYGENFMKVDAVFAAVGRIPNTDLVKGKVETDSSGYIVADETGRTNVPGVFAVGDVRTKHLRQIITAASDGANASKFVQEYIDSIKE